MIDPHDQTFLIKTIYKIKWALFEVFNKRRKQNISLARLLDRTLRAGMQASREPRRPRRRYREQTHAMGAPSVTLDKALALAAVLEDKEIVRKMMLRK